MPLKSAVIERISKEIRYSAIDRHITATNTIPRLIVTMRSVTPYWNDRHISPSTSN